MTVIDATTAREVRDLIGVFTRRDVSALGLDDDLVAAIGIDSMEGLQILAGVEKHFGVRLRDDELIEMRTIRRIVRGVNEAAR